MSFEEVAQVLGTDLPASAYRHRPWWANEAAGHVHAKAWLEAGYETANVDMAGKKLVFRRIAKSGYAPSQAMSPTGMKDEAHMFRHGEKSSATDGLKPRRSPLFGAMKGTFTIEPGWDVTRPALDPEEMAEWEASLERKADMIDEGLSGKHTGKRK